MIEYLEQIDRAQVIAFLIEHSIAVVLALVIFLIGRPVARLVTGFIRRGMRARDVEETLVSFLCNIAYSLLYGFVVIAALSQLGIETTSLAAILAAAGLAIGLALQGSLSNFAAGVLIILFRPFKVGDYVEAGGTSGTVEEVNIFTTHLRTPDNKAVIVPNAAVTGQTITNYSAKPTRRLDLVFGIGYDDDIRKAKQLLEEIIDADERVLRDPAPVIAVLSLGDSSVNFAVRPWCNAADYWNLHFHLHETVKLRFDEAGITIPYPQRDVHLHGAAA